MNDIAWSPEQQQAFDGASKLAKELPAAFAAFYEPPANPSGINPTEFKVLVKPAPVEETTKGGIILAQETVDKQKFATTEGTIIAASPLAFTYVTEKEWAGNKPKPGDKCVFPKYAGMRRKGKDGEDYVIIADKDVLATIEE